MFKTIRALVTLPLLLWRCPAPNPRDKPLPEYRGKKNPTAK